MQFRAGLFLLVFAVALGLGCRKPLSPNVDRNRAPETWITAAPQDTLTQKDPTGAVIRPPEPGTIAVKFHMYWAGSDDDGAVTGFYYAVVETLPQPPPGLDRIPPLPGPKASDYKYTARTDSTFIFTVSAAAPDRQHAFFIYAVDNQGKPDPTPARVIFNALDRFPPLPIIDERSSATGPIYRLRPWGVEVKDTTIFLRDSLDIRNPTRAPADSIPADARIDFIWRGEPTIAGSFVTGYEYKLDEPAFQPADATVTSKSYNTGINGDMVQPGIKIFTLRAIDVAGGVREVTRRFQMNRSPETWYAGPDTVEFDRVYPRIGRHRGLPLTSWNTLPAIPGSLLGCDSLLVRPAARKASRTFFEIYKDTLWVRSEGDTVHRNSWVLVHAGGADLDSPYSVQVEPGYPVPGRATCETGLDSAHVVIPTGPQASPIGFQLQAGVATEVGNRGLYQFSAPTQGLLYPYYSGTSSLGKDQVGGYWEMRQSGKAYIVARAVDGDGQQDKRVPSMQLARRVVDEYDAGIRTPENEALRPLILSFWVNRNPSFLFSRTEFWPKPPEWNGGVVASVPDSRLPISLLGMDPDPLELATQPPRTGGPSSGYVLRWDVTVIGKNAAGRDTTYRIPEPVVGTLATASIVIDLQTDAPYITSQDLTLRIELCDCAQCEAQPGTGRCITTTIPVRVRATTAASRGADVSHAAAPGSPPANGRSYAP
jgi:hypothetical protein